MYTLQQNWPVLGRPQRTQGRITSKKSRPEKRSCRNVADDFLRYSFSPILTLPHDHLPQNEAEAHFFASLRHVESAYKLAKTPLSERTYPYNILDAFNWIKTQVDKVDDYEKLFLVENGRFPYCLATASIWDTGRHMYYLSFDALLRIGRDRRNRKATGLLQATCAYLSQIARMPSYVTGDGVGSVYEQLWDYYTQEHFDADMDDDADEDSSADSITGKERLQERIAREKQYQKVAFELDCADHFGRKMQKTLDHPHHLDAWHARLQQFKPKTDSEARVYTVCQKLFDLYLEYPERKFFQQLCAKYWYSENDCIMHADLYLSFVWSLDGWLGNEAYQFINDMSESYDGSDEPLQYQIFDHPCARPANNLDFEKRLFTLVDDLAYLIYNYQKP